MIASNKEFGRQVRRRFDIDAQHAGEAMKVAQAFADETADCPAVVGRFSCLGFTCDPCRRARGVGTKSPSKRSALSFRSSGRSD
jgi:hypothetical protein